MARVAKMAIMVKMAKNVKMAKTSKLAKIVEISMIPESEIVMFLKTFKIWVFFEKLDGYSKRTWILLKIGKFAVERVSNGFISWN